MRVLSRLILSLAVLVTAPALASEHTDDLRWLRRAEVERREGLCASIRDRDMRASCRASVSGREGQCAGLRNSAERALCRSRAR